MKLEFCKFLSPLSRGADTKCGVCKNIGFHTPPCFAVRPSQEGNIFFLFLLVILLISSSALAAISTFKQAEFPKYLPSLGDSAAPASTNNAGGSVLIHQNYVVKGQNLDLYAKQYMKELRAREWKVRQYIRKSLADGKAKLIISAVHPMEYDLRLVLTNAGIKNRDFRLQLILKKSTKVKRAAPVH